MCRIYNHREFALIVLCLYVSSESFPFLLLGNKSDLGGKVTKADVNRWLQNRGYKNMVYLETSALNNTNITEAFDQVARSCLANCAHDLVYVKYIVYNNGYSQTIYIYIYIYIYK